MLSICDHTLDSRDKKREELSRGETPNDETLRKLTSHFDPPQCKEGDRTTTMKWLVVGVESNIFQNKSRSCIVLPLIDVKLVVPDSDAQDLGLVLTQCYQCFNCTTSVGEVFRCHVAKIGA